MTDFSYKPTLTGDKVTLRCLTVNDFDAMWAAMQDPEVTRLTGSHGELTPERAREWMRTRADQPDRLDLAIVDNETGECVGEAVLNEWDPDNESCSFRILIGPTGRGRGLGTEATRLIVGYGFEKLGLHRISLEVYAFNPRARRAYEKAGFVTEGVLRDALLWEGERVDATVMSILAPEWPTI
ncbi:GNAT family N-acetyltransferase [Kribbella deserti]|uniref:GNAT family N-acetyltransferase n=1 Tax=Kribbella deserti TaxID=1926257 RepID=A0ABV6QIG3_9ACTN